PRKPVQKRLPTHSCGVLVGLNATGLEEEVFKEALAENFAGKPKVIEFNQMVLEAGAQWARENVKI
ncbi:MAG: hypothetical protein WAO81_10900, partial [Methanosarcina flavescens]